MTDAAPFQRARKPEEIGLRRAALLAAAAALFDEHGPDGAGLNAIAARAGFTKSNVYRYFESREAVLLELFLADFAALVAELEQRWMQVPPGDLPALARTTATTFLSRPRLCELLSILTGVLERNVTTDNVVRLKSEMLGLSERLATALGGALPQLSPADAGWAVAMIGAFVSGLWPAANPNPIVAEVLQRPAFAALCFSLERDLERAVLALLKGLTCG